MKKLVTAVVLALASFSLAQDAAKPQAAVQAEVPVKAVVLYSSGVGYFEHFGSVKGDGTTELRFKTAQINDILKSLVLQDLDGGKVTTVTYPSQDPIDKTLKSFQVDITGNPPMADLLNQLRGARVKVKVFADTVEATILGVEKRPLLLMQGSPPVDSWIVNLAQGGTIRSIELNKLTDIQLLDPKLQEELERALSALSQARDQDKKPVSIRFTGDGERRIRLGYVVESPIWKTSYRLLLGEKNRLQGWAIVENQTDNDWNEVQLSLVSGRPISFVQDLYQPLYIPRPVVKPELYASLRPQEYEGGMAADKEMAGRFGVPAAPPAMSAPAPMRARRQVDQLAKSGEMESDSLKAASVIDASASVQSVASAAKVGELFQYTVGNVSLPRQKSAMIPIITDDIEVEKLSIYNESVLQKNPLNGARVKNTTGKHLLAGPVTVLEGSTYSGDARVDNVPPGQERLLSYGIDLQMRVDATKNTSSAVLQTGKIVKGTLRVSRKHTSAKEYLSENKTDADKTLIIEHPIRQWWKLVDTDKPIETTETLYRFKGVVPAQKSSKLVVKEENVVWENLQILPMDLTTLVFYSRAGEIPDKVKEALAKAVQLKQAVVDSQRQWDERVQRTNQISTEQNRIRENMKTVERNSPYYNRLMAKLNEQETQLEGLQKEADDLQKQTQDRQKELEAYLNELNVE